MPRALPFRAVLVTLLTDYGIEDDFVGVCHAVIAGIAPQARIVDLSHGIPRHDVRTGAIVLRRVLPFAPAGVHVAVVDPEVGGRRRAIAVRTAEGDRLLVGPDNGLLSPAADRFGGVVQAVEISTSPCRLTPVSATFHGRDLFSPVAAHLAAGVDVAEVGEPLDPAELVRLDLPTARLEGDEVVAHVLAVDRYGNVTLDAEHGMLARSGLRLGQSVVVEAAGAEHAAVYAHAFTDVAAGELLLYEDAYRTLALAVNRGSAAEQLRVGLDTELRVLPA